MFEINDEKYNKLLSLSSLDKIKNECLTNIIICSLTLKNYEMAVTYANEVYNL